MAESTAYSCPQCRATLKLDPHSGKLTCDFCGGSFTVDEIEARVDEVSYSRKKAKAQDAADTAAAVAAAAAVGDDEEEPAYAKFTASGRRKQREKEQKEESKKTKLSDSVMKLMESPTLAQWDAILAAGTQEKFDEMVGYTCTNCGAQVVADKLTVATSCQYCGSSVVVDQRLSGGLKPGFVIPFKVKADDLPEKLTKFYSERPLLPKNFFYDNHVGEVQGIYVPFWLYDGTVAGEARYDGVDYSYYTEGDYDVTERRYYHCDRAGTMTFDNVPVDASERIDDDLMDSIEPFDYREMQPFKAGYLTGFVAERFDQSPREVLDRAMNRMGETAREAMRGTVDHDYSYFETGHFECKDPAASYVLLPVYLFNCKYAGKHYRYAVNGQTGKIVGEVPTGKKESFMCFLKTFVKTTVISAVVVAILGVIGMFCL